MAEILKRGIASRWCDALVEANKAQGREAKVIMERLRGPHVPKDRGHYAMNPNCTANSPPDVVLLFETRAGWNQHGGPELFTFDNHEPKGGCVLFNDGSVRFIRTEAELKQLRWK